MADGGKLNDVPLRCKGEAAGQGGGLLGLPLSNRGVNRSALSEAVLANVRESVQRTWAGIDWVAGSVDLWEFLQEAGWLGECTMLDGLAEHLRAYGPKKKIREADENGELITGERQVFVPPGDVERSIVKKAFAWLFEGCGLVLATDAGPSSFYAYRWVLTNVFGDHAGMIELGGELTQRKNGHPSLRFELTGLGCQLFELRGDMSADHAQRWCALRAKLERVDAQLSRVDIAYDDFDGQKGLELAKCMYDLGEFDYKFGGAMKRPQAKGFEDYGSNKGCTFYVGNSTSEKQLRVYEKGKQLGDPDSPWVRWELQLRGSTRKRMALDVLVKPMDYMRGAFACLDFVSSCMARLVVTKEATKATFKSVLRHVKRQYGPFMNYLRVVSDDPEMLQRVVEALGTDKVPKWARKGRLDREDALAFIQVPVSNEEIEDGYGDR